MNEQEGIWLRVKNVRLVTGKEVQIQVEGDHHDREPVWWPVAKDLLDDDPFKRYQAIQEGLDKKRVVLGQLKCQGKTLHCGDIRLQFTESRPL